MAIAYGTLRRRIAFGAKDAADVKAFQEAESYRSVTSSPTS